MSDAYWQAILARLSPDHPADLDDDLFRAERPPEAMGARPKVWAGRAAAISPSGKLWPQSDRSVSFIGVRVSKPMPDCVGVAARLAAAAIERRVFPIILSRVGNCGFERFGFRVERVPPTDPVTASRFEDDLSRFWDLALIIDAEDVSRLQ